MPTTLARPYPGTVQRLGSHGSHVVAIQRSLKIRDDGIFGPQTQKAVMAFQAMHRLAVDGEVGPQTWNALFNGKVIKPIPPKALTLAERAYFIAAAEVGIHESGGNNAGTPFIRYEKPNGATSPEPWCGDFLAYCYRRAGSKAVDRRWASVWGLGTVAGVKKVDQLHVVRGDIVRFNFKKPQVDYTHVAMFVRWLDASKTRMETIDGNTTAYGAVGDPGTGRDAVFRKQSRTIHDVIDFRHVAR